MRKRNPYIAVLTLLIALAGSAWAIWTVASYTLYNPTGRIDVRNLPPEAFQETEYSFEPIGSTIAESKPMAIIAPIPTGIPWPPSIDTVFPYLMNHEGEYASRAQTLSAFDPLSDTFLQDKLRALIQIREDDEAERLKLALSLYDEFGNEVKDALFQTALYNFLATETLKSSMDNPNVYPLRLAEVKSGFYESGMNEASQRIDRGRLSFDKAVDEQISKLRKDQEILAEGKIQDIRDYLLEKTSAIEQESPGDNGGDV